MEQIDSLARRYGVEPAAIVGETDPVKAASINLWAHNWGVQRDNRLLRDSQRKYGNR